MFAWPYLYSYLPACLALFCIYLLYMFAWPYLYFLQIYPPPKCWLTEQPPPLCCGCGSRLTKHPHPHPLCALLPGRP